MTQKIFSLKYIAALLLTVGILILGGLNAEQIFQRVIDLIPERGVVLGIGNIVGLGQEIVLHFKNQAVRRG